MILLRNYPDIPELVLSLWSMPDIIFQLIIGFLLAILLHFETKHFRSL